MKVWTCDDHDGHWPVPVASVVVAPDEQTARDLLDRELNSRGLTDGRKHPYKLSALDLDRTAVRVLSDGEY